MVSYVHGAGRGWGCHTLQEVGGPAPHSRVDVCFGRLDVVVEVVAESLDVRDDLFPSLEDLVGFHRHLLNFLVGFCHQIRVQSCSTCTPLGGDQGGSITSNAVKSQAELKLASVALSTGRDRGKGNRRD